MLDELHCNDGTKARPVTPADRRLLEEFLASLPPKRLALHVEAPEEKSPHRGQSTIAAQVAALINAGSSWIYERDGAVAAIVTRFDFEGPSIGGASPTIVVIVGRDKAPSEIAEALVPPVLTLCAGRRLTLAFDGWPSTPLAALDVARSLHYGSGVIACGIRG